MLKDLGKSESYEWLMQLCCLDCAMGNHFDKAWSDANNKAKYLSDVSILEVELIEEGKSELDANSFPAAEQVSAD